MRLDKPSCDTAEVSFSHHLWMEDATYPAAMVLVFTVGLCHPPVVIGAAPNCINGNGHFFLSAP